MNLNRVVCVCVCVCAPGKCGGCTPWAASCWGEGTLQFIVGVQGSEGLLEQDFLLWTYLSICVTSLESLCFCCFLSVWMGLLGAVLV